MHIKNINMKTTTKNTIIKQKQSLVHKVPSGVAIMSHVCGGAAIVHPQGKIGIFIPGKWGETRKFLSLQVKNWNGSRHLVFWLLGTLTGI